MLFYYYCCDSTVFLNNKNCIKILNDFKNVTLCEFMRPSVIDIDSTFAVLT